MFLAWCKMDTCQKISFLPKIYKFKISVSSRVEEDSTSDEEEEDDDEDENDLIGRKGKAPNELLMEV